jgi:inner membrane protease ATP23
MENLVNMGCKPPSRFIRCIDCGNVKAGGGFGILEETISNLPCDPKKNLSFNGKEEETSVRKLVPEIFLCQQHLVNEQHAHESLVHELIHAIDLCRTNMDPINNCIHMACTEIRAENLSGECNWTREIMYVSIPYFHCA